MSFREFARLFRRTQEEPQEEHSFGGMGVEIGQTIVSRRSELERAHCEECQRVVPMFKLTHEPSNPELYEGPPFTIECVNGHVQT